MNETVLITGASSGIGLEMARCAAAEGSNLILVARREERLRNLAAELAEQHGVTARVMVRDLEDPDSPRAIVDELDGMQVEVLVNNAGFGARGPFAETRLVDQIAMLRVNVEALTHLTRLMLPAMLERGRGGVINVASTAGFQPGPYMSVYYASKAYVLSLSEALAEETKGTGVTVTCLAPGPTRTEFQQRAGAKRAWVSQLNPGTAEDVARIGWNGFRSGKVIVIPGTTNRIFATLVQIVPRVVARKATALLNDRQMAAK